MANHNHQVLLFCEGFAGTFPGYSCQHVPGAGFDRNFQGVTVRKGNQRIGTVLLTEVILEDIPFTEILSRLKKLRMLDILQKDKPIVFGNAGIL